MIALILAAQLAATSPTPVIKAESGQTRTLADVARERKLGKPGVKGGSFSAATSSVRGDKDEGTPQERATLEKMGFPKDINITTTFDGNGGRHEHAQWIYPGGVYVYFRDGVMTAVQR